MPASINSVALVVALLGNAPLLCLCGSPPQFAPGSAYPNDATFVYTESGLVHGLVQDGGVHTYLGIPYAAPPTNTGRWMAPAPHKPWGGTPWDNGSILNATTYGSPCAQYGPAWPTLGGWPNDGADEFGTSSEDCTKPAFNANNQIVLLTQPWQLVDV